jgi:hypothetical protein
MDAVAFPLSPALFLDDDLDFGNFTFASAPQPPTATFDSGDFVASGLGSDAGTSAPTATPAAAPSSPWEKPRGPLPLSLFGADADDDGQEEEEGPTGPPPMATAPQCALSVPSNGHGAPVCSVRPTAAAMFWRMTGLSAASPVSSPSSAPHHTFAASLRLRA